MIVRFNSLNRTERPVLTLCNPGSTYDNGKLTNVVGILTNHEAEENVFNFNSSSELNFRLNKVTTGDDEADEYMRFLYDAVKNKRLIFIDDIGFFLINNVQEQYDNLNTFKDVTAKSIDIELQQRNIPFIPDGTYRFLDGDGKSGILNMIVDTLPYWTIGTVDSSVASKYRTFEDVDTSLNCLGFMIDNLQNAYECIILFDTINRTINVYDQNNYIHQTDIHISKNDIINMSKVSESSDDLYTAITVSGDSDVLISAINPLGTNTLYNFSYYLDWMSAPLKEKVIAWNAKISSHEADYYNLNLDYYNKEKQAHDIELEINRLETQLSMYERCRDNIVANNDTDYVISYNEAISASGGTVITIKPEISQTLAEIDRLIGICRTNMSSAQTQLSAINTQIEAIADEINTIRSDVSFTNNFTNDELSELNNYVFEGTYKDEYVVITDIMDYAEQFSQMKILYDRARAQLLRISQPTQEFEIDVENFLFEREFAHASDQLETGCLINVELNDNDIAELFLSSIKVNYDDHNLSLTFGNRYNKFDPKTLFDNVLGSVSKSANTLGYVKDLLYPIKTGELNAIKNQLQSARDLSMIGALTSDNEEVVIDSSGYTGRKKLADGIYDPKQIKITNNNIVFTKDGWETSSLAIGDIILPDESSVYGVNAQALIGDIIIGTELHIKDSQGQDILTVIDGRISTEVSEVKAAAASGTFEYYDPSNLNWTEQNNVDYFGYGLSQDEAETDTGIKAAGNNNKYFLNKHNGNLYKSNGTKWVFQKTLSPRFNNYSTIAYTDNKASTAESNAITNATNQVSTAKATIASSTLKYDETGIIVSYYGYGVPTEIAGATQGKIYLDQNDGYYYTKGSGSNWTKSSSALPLYADQKANTAKSEAISAASADATQKANQAEENAIADATNQVNNATTTIANATNKYDTTGLTITYFGYGVPDIATATSGQKYLDQNDGYVYTKKSGSGWTKSSTALKLVTTKVAEDASADASSKANTAESNAIANATNQVNNATTTIANAVSKYDTTGLTISYCGYGTPDISTATSGQKYLDQDTGYVYTKNSGSGWTKSVSALTLITTKVATDAANDATTKANNAISTAATDATAKANTAENNAKTAAANAMSKYDEGSLTINYYGFGAPTTVAGSSQGEIYLDQNTGYYYTKGSGSTWTKSANALPLYADQKATEAYNNALGYVATYYITSEDSDTKINQTKQEIEMKAAKAVNKYEVPVGITVNFAGYGTPAVQGVKATAANQYYLDQETGNLYKSDSNKNWGSTPTHSLPIITDKLDTKITQTANDITLSVSQNYSTKTETSDAFDNAKTYADGKASTAESNAKTYAEGKASTAESNAKTYAEEQASTAESNAIANTTSQVNSAKSTIAGATSKYDTSGQTITYYGYGTPNISGASSGQKYLDQDSGYVYTKGSGSTWTKSSTPLTLISTKVAQDAATDATNKANDAKIYAEGQATQAKNDAIADTVNKLKNYSTTTQMNTAITESAESIRLAASKAVSKYDITDKTVNFYAYGLSDDLTTTDTGIKATGNSGKFVLNQTDGRLYKSNGSKWVYQETLTTITDKLDSKITVTAEGIRSDVSANYSTKTYAENQASTAESNAKTYAEGKANTAESNAKTYAEGKANTAESNAKTYAEGKANTAESNAKTYAEGKATEAENNAKSYADDLSDEMTTTINQTANAIEMKAAKAVSKYQIPNGMTIHFAGYGTPIAQGAVATEANQNYLDQETGRVYTSKANKSWDMNSYQSLQLITDNLDAKIDVTATNITQTVSQTYSTKNETATAANNARDAAIDDTILRLNDYYTKTQADTVIDQTAEQISLEANALLESTVGYTSKNRIEMTINTVTKNGITFTVDKSAGTITVSGTATKQAAVSVPISPELSGDYYFSGAPVGGSSSKYDLYAWDVTTGARVKKFDGVTNCSSDYGGTSQEIKLIKGHTSQLTVRIQSGFTANNLVFRLMIRDKAFADDDTFEPFANVQSVTTNLQSQITQNANQIQLKVSAGDVCSVISQSSDTITLSSGRLIINAGNFQLDSTGRMTATAGNFGGWEIGSTWDGSNWDHYIESTDNQYGSIKWHSISYGDIPAGTSPEFVTALDITDENGDNVFKVAMDGALYSTFAFFDECMVDRVFLGRYISGEEHMDLCTGHLYREGSGSPAITFWDASDNELLSLIPSGIKWKGSGIFAEVTNFLNVGTALAFGASSMPLRLASSIVEVDHSMNFYTAGDGIQLSGNHCFRLYNDEVAIGISSKNVRFYAQNVYLPNGSAVTSDERQKHNIERLDERYLDVIKNIEPVRFQYLDNPLDNYHSGFIAQDVLKALSVAGLSQSEVGAFVDTKGDGSDYALRYGEFIPMLQKWVKELDDRITEIERKIRNE